MSRSKVFFVPTKDNPTVDEQVNAIAKLADAADMPDIIEPNDFTAIKLHVGEQHNTTHVRPEIIREIVSICHKRTPNVFLTETSTLYKGERENAIKHIAHAYKHGFGFENIGAPFIMADGLIGSTEIEIPIEGGLEKSVKIAREIAFSDVLITVSHATGHMVTGFGACLKNLGMGLASRAGKMRQHSSVAPRVKEKLCRLCGKCILWCPEQAIAKSGETALIDMDKCIGCGECMTMCRCGAIEWNWGSDSATVQRSMAEHAYGVIKDKAGKCFFINVLVGMTADCDCMTRNQTKIIPDMGLLGSYDPLAVDKATLDLTADANGSSLAELAHGKLDAMIQLNHAVKLGMGSLEYDLVEAAK